MMKFNREIRELKDDAIFMLRSVMVIGILTLAFTIHSCSRMNPPVTVEVKHNGH